MVHDSTTFRLVRGVLAGAAVASVVGACTATSSLDGLTAGDGGAGGDGGAAAASGSGASGGNAGTSGSGGVGGSAAMGGAAGVAGAAGISGGGGAAATDASAGGPNDAGDAAPEADAVPPPSCDDLEKNGTETGIDCGGGCPDLCVDGEGCASGTDCVSDFCRPDDSTCWTPTCTDGFSNQDETDVDCGGGCDPCMDGKACLDHPDCVSAFCHPTERKCRPPGCNDGEQNQDETDVDCGGVCGATCADGDDCAVHGDCADRFCHPTELVCRTPTCTDGFLNQDETDFDCGGKCGPTCEVGEVCAVGGDCTSTFCRPTDTTCRAPSCSDGFQNRDEAEVDCGGTSCPPCPTCWGDATNFDFSHAALSFGTAVTLSCSPTIDTSQPPASMLSGWCGAAPTPVIQTQPGGPDIVVVPMSSFTLDAGRTLRLIGSRPVVLAVRGDARINGTVDAGAVGTTPGAGGDDARNGPIATDGQVAGSDCAVFANGSGEGMEDGSRSLGGGGAGLRTNGGFGGGERGNFRCYKAANGYECKPYCPDAACDNSFIDSSSRFAANNSVHYGVVPIRGLAAPDQDLSPLRAGCAGGKGDRRSAGGLYFGGSGGGAVQITVTGTLAIGAGGIISAGGGGGSIPSGNDGGSGGGSGGAILIEASVLDLSLAGGIRAHGGGGAGRGCASTAQNGHVADDAYATHPGCSSAGRGGLSYWDVANPACNGTGATVGTQAACTLPGLAWPTNTLAYPQAGGHSDNNGGGGGGGSGGLIRVRRLVLAGACGN